MKKILGILGTITIAGSGMVGLVGNAPAPTKEKHNIIKRAPVGQVTKDENYIDYQLFVFESDRLYVAISRHTWQAIKNIHNANINNKNEFNNQVYHLISNFRRDNRADSSSNNAIVKAIWDNFDRFNDEYNALDSWVGLRIVINHNSNLFEVGGQIY
ncbi:hypothetical protein [Spiroplasma endosymbiont of Tipula paludosa]|uniref:hypothetical protein n=1 Tax=Spiroplasma endosymbiont of Tipula paludosa TaxID=3066295 RepID=UPI0035C8BE6F